MKNTSLVPLRAIEHMILLLRGQRVMLDSDLATLYGVETKVLNRAVKRNQGRFPKDFMFQLTAKETENLRFQFGTSKWGGRRYLPHVFSEQGVAMLSTVLNSERAIRVNIAIIRTFVKLRQILSSHKELAHTLEQLERKIERHDQEIQSLFDAMRQLLEPPEKPKRQIGFHTK